MSVALCARDGKVKSIFVVGGSAPVRQILIEQKTSCLNS